MNIHVRLAVLDDLPDLIKLEQQCFDTDQLTPRRFKHWIQADNSFCLVAMVDETIVGYGLVIMRLASRSARLYSLAVDPDFRGRKIAQQLLLNLETLAINRDKLFMRLEVAENNKAAIEMYQHLGYKKFGVYRAYYANGSNALRFQKAIKQNIAIKQIPQYPWYQQSTEFTCGPASLMMALNKLEPNFIMSAEAEIDIWRQATTVFMTSGQGGCHPVGLALAGKNLGFSCEVFLSQSGNLFVEGVRSEYKKSIMKLVDQQFFEKAKKQNIPVHSTDYTLQQIKDALDANCSVICLISTYQFDGKKAPHWVAITHIDDTCLYLHDPDASINGVNQAFENNYPEFDENGIKGAVNLDLGNSNSVSERMNILAASEEKMHQASNLDHQHVPILKQDFAKLSTFGKAKLRACVIVSNH